VRRRSYLAAQHQRHSLRRIGTPASSRRDRQRFELGAEPESPAQPTASPPKILAVSVETKGDGASEAGAGAVGHIAAAWHERMCWFVREKYGPNGSEEKRTITLPLLLIGKHDLVISFVCDRGDRLEVVGDMPLGDTRTMRELYCWSRLCWCAWAEGSFPDWAIDLLP
jgi:hypothetical protein